MISKPGLWQSISEEIDFLKKTSVCKFFFKFISVFILCFTVSCLLSSRFPHRTALLYKLTQVIGTCSRKQTHECPPPTTVCVSLGGRDKMFGKSKTLLNCGDQNLIQKLKTHSDCKVFLAVFPQGAPRPFTAVLLLYTRHALLALGMLLQHGAPRSAALKLSSDAKLL